MAPRSYLFVPGDRPERFAKALASEADCVVLDLEDAVPPEAKAEARRAVAALLAAGEQRDRLVVRINDATTPWFTADLDLLRDTAAAAVMVPKAERTDTLETVLAACPGTTLLPLIESGRGVMSAPALAAHPGVQRLVFGTLDYALDMNLEGPLATTLGLDAAAAALSLASRAAGREGPVAGVTLAVDDPAQLQNDMQRAQAHGFTAKLCIHPKQVAALHELLSPSAAALEWARRVLEAAENSRNGAVQLDGRMIDKPVIERARRTVQQARSTAPRKP